MGKVYEYRIRRGDEYEQSEAGGEYSSPYVRGCMIVIMTAGIITAADDINTSIIGIIILPFDYAKIGIVRQLEVENASARWHLGKGCNPKSKQKLTFEVVLYWYLNECCQTVPVHWVKRR